MCERWRTSFTDFLADMGSCPIGYSLDRIDSDGDYEPGNCRWATASEQARNRRASLHVDLHGQLMHVNEAADLLGIRPHRMWRLVRKFGWTTQEIELSLTRGGASKCKLKTLRLAS